MVEAMSGMALAKSSQFTLERYGAGLDAAAERFAPAVTAERG